MKYDFSTDLEATTLRGLTWAINNDDRNAEILERTCVAVAVVICAIAKGNQGAAELLLRGSEGYIAGEVARILLVMKP